MKKVRTGLLMLVAATGCLMAQTAPAPTVARAKSAAPQAKAVAAQPSTPAKAKTTAKKPVKKASGQKAAAEPNVATATGTDLPKKGSHTAVAGKRDPFVSPIRTNANVVNCSGGGKRCLVVDQTNLEGIVKAPNGMIAVVSNAANKAYFLRENDPVYNGFVLRITPDTVVFREQMTDKFGKTSTREVVKKVNAPVV